MLACRLYGLGVRADVPLAALAGLPSAGRADLRLFLESLPGWCTAIAESRWLPYGEGPSAAPAGESCVRASRLDDGSHYRLQYADGTVFVIEAGGRALWAGSAPGATIDDTATYLLGPVMGFVLRLRGTPCLHASAVAVDGRAIVLAAHSGGGKSSTAAAFARLGFPVLTDDVAALADDGGTIRVQPAYPRVRLWPDAVEAMFGAAEALPRLTPTWSKRFLALDGADAPFQGESLPLGTIYLFEDRRAGLAAPVFEPLAPRTALLWLVGHSYVTYLLDRDMRAREFGLLARVARDAALVRVTPPDDIGRIEALCEAIAEDARCREACAGPPRRREASRHASL